MTTTTPQRDGDLDGSPGPVRVAVVFHSGYGHTRVQAEAVHHGASRVPGVEADLVPVDEVDSRWDALDAADAIVFGAPTYMAGPSAPFKAFLDATSPRWQEQRWKDKLAAGFTNSAGLNGDKLATLQALALFAMQHGMVWVGLGLPPGNTRARARRRTSTGCRVPGRDGPIPRRPARRRRAPARRPPHRRAPGRARRSGGPAVAAVRRSGGEGLTVDARFAAVAGVLGTYLDGLHHSDTARLRAVFHPAARYVTATDGTLLSLSMDEYLPVVDARPSPASKGEERRDRIVSIELAGPVTAFARVECRIAPRSFTDLLTLVDVDGGWRIVSKVFHYDLDRAEDPCPT